MDQKTNKYNIKRPASKHAPFYNRKFSDALKKKHRSMYDPKEEARLERIVFGDANDVINNLVDDKTVKNDNKSINISDEKITHDNQYKLEHDAIINDDDDEDEVEDKKAAWKDDDDHNYTVDTALNAQNRKVKCEIPGQLYTEYLENKYKVLVDTPKWAELEKTSKANDDDDILKHSSHLETSKITNLPKNIIDIKALMALNKSTHTEGPIITSVQFHPSSTVALVAGTSGVLSLFQVDGHTNNKLHSTQFKKFPISKAVFMKEGTEILLGSQHYAHYYTYNLMNGKTYKLPLPHGITNMKHYEVSPDGKLIALCGRLGEIYLLHSYTKELISTLKMNAKCRALAFVNNETLITHGDNNEMYIWDLNSRICVHRAIDDGCLSCMSLAISPSTQFVATGSAQGVVNLYSTKTVLEDKSPMPLKTVMNLVTSITNLKFNPTSEILTIASEKKHNAFKMLHIPSFTVFSNFPTFQTSIGMPQTVNFSPGSGYLGISNKTGSALLYRLRHYENY